MCSYLDFIIRRLNKKGDNKMYDVLDIAEYIIKRGWEMGDCINCLKLQKILYFVQTQFMVAENYPCFSEKIEAWEFGPVIPIVYRKYIKFGNATLFDDYITQDFDYISDEDKENIDAVIKMALPYSSAELVKITQNQLPWMNAIVRKNKEIKIESLREYFCDITE